MAPLVVSRWHEAYWRCGVAALVGLAALLWPFLTLPRVLALLVVLALLDLGFEALAIAFAALRRLAHSHGRHS